MHVRGEDFVTLTRVFLTIAVRVPLSETLSWRLLQIFTKKPPHRRAMSAANVDTVLGEFLHVVMERLHQMELSRDAQQARIEALTASNQDLRNRLERSYYAPSYRPMRQFQHDEGY